MHDWLDFPEKLLISIGKIAKHVSIVRCPWYFMHALVVKNIQGSFLCIDVDYKKSACWKSLCPLSFSQIFHGLSSFLPPPLMFAYQKRIINGFTLDQWIAYGWYLNFVSKSLEIFITCWSHWQRDPDIQQVLVISRSFFKKQNLKTNQDAEKEHGTVSSVSFWHQASVKKSVYG